LVQSGWNITLVCAWQPDEVVLDRLQQGVSVKSVEHWHDDYIKALDCVEKFDMVIAEKLHVGVVAACRNVPFIALNYRSKVLDYCRSIGWENFCVDLHDLKPGVIIDMVNMLTRGRDEYLETLHENVSAIRARLLQAVPRVVSALARPSAETNRQA
jgi:polysaccharide pyruvyl transferase WcaK-like protein